MRGLAHRGAISTQQKISVIKFPTSNGLKLAEVHCDSREKHLGGVKVIRKIYQKYKTMTMVLNI